LRSEDFLNKEVEVIIDRPINSKHPKYNFLYEVNYGYIPNTISGDGEELDVYILGVNKALKEFRGKCIAIIRRLNENDDKLIVVENEKSFTDKEIREATYFQEKWFDSIIIRG